MTTPTPVCPLMHEPSALTGWDLTAWVTYEGRPMHRHLVPCGDLRRHQLDPTCWCQPTVAEGEFGRPALWAHNSADGREAFEVGDRKPS